MTDRTRKPGRRKGAALLVVLGVVMVITIVALAYISRSDGELAFGQNMLLRIKADFLAESGLEHARGLILNPQEVSGEYWTGAASQQIEDGDFYYSVSVEPNAAYSGPTRWCNYDISCRGYRVTGGERTAQSNLAALLRLNPCVAYWSDTSEDRQLSSAITINGDLYCRGNITNYALIEGDAFGALTGTITGQIKTCDELTLQWPDVNIAGFTAKYTFEPVSSPLSGVVCGPYVKCDGDLDIAGDVQINGMLIVDGDLRISGTGNLVRANKALPAMLVSGDLIIEEGGQLSIEGLAVVNGAVNVSVGCEGLDVLGGAFTGDGILEFTKDWAGNRRDAMIVGEPLWLPVGGQVAGAADFDGSSDKIEEYGAEDYLNGLSAITVLCWVKSDVTNQDRGIFFTRAPTGGVDEELGLRYDKDGALGGGTRGIKASLKTNLGYTQIESTSNVQTTNWQHLALVWKSGQSVKLYIDGTLNSPRYDKGVLFGTITGVEKFMLGCGVKGQYWDGKVDDLQIYNRALDVNDIQTVKNGFTTSGLIAHWKLDEDGQRQVVVTAAPAKTAIWCWSASGDRRRWAQAGGAFYKAIRRN